MINKKEYLKRLKLSKWLPVFAGFLVMAVGISLGACLFTSPLEVLAWWIVLGSLVLAVGTLWGIGNLLACVAIGVEKRVRQYLEDRGL